MSASTEQLDKISMKIHNTPHGIIIAACDSELVGKSINSDEGIKLTLTPEFYNGVRVNAKTFIEHLALCAIANLVGKYVVQLAVEAGFVDKTTILWLGDIPHAQIVLF